MLDVVQVVCCLLNVAAADGDDVSDDVDTDVSKVDDAQG